MKHVYLRDARTRARLTQEELEAKAGVPQSVISRLERAADATPAFDTVVKLADALGVDPRALRFGQREAVAS